MNRVVSYWHCICIVILPHSSILTHLHPLSFPQLSKLSLQSQTVPFLCDDVAVGSPSNQEELAQCQEELNEVRAELDQKLHEVESLNGELASLKEESEELDDQRRMLQVTHLERNQLEQEVRGVVKDT